MPNRADVVEAARRMLGTRWRHQGRAPGLGLDCAGLVICVGKELGLLNFDTVAYPRDAAANHFIDYFRVHGHEVAPTQLSPGSVLALRESKYPCHCGIIAAQGDTLTLIHAYAMRRKVVEERLNAEWLNRIVGVFEYRGID